MQTPREEPVDGRIFAGAAPALLAQRTVPANAAGWVLVGQLTADAPSRRDCPLTGGLALDALHRGGLATATVMLPAFDPAAAAERVALAAAELARELEHSTAIAFLGEGAAARAAWVAARHAPLRGVVAWDARPELVWRRLSRVQVPSLLVLDRSAGAWRLRVAAARAARIRLAEGTDLVLGASRGDLDFVAAWYHARLLATSAARSRRRCRPRRTVSAAAAAAVVIGGMAAVAAPAAQARRALPDFTRRLRLEAERIGGDDAAIRPAANVRGGDGEGVKRLRGNAILADCVDACPGADGLTDGAGVRWWINTDISFSTSSSGSGALSEVSFTHATTASTFNGGIAHSELNDGANGYSGLCISLNGSTGPCQTRDASYDLYEKLGTATSGCDGREVILPLQTDGSLQVQRSVFVPTNDTFARWLNSVTNTGGSPVTVDVSLLNNTGGDNSSLIGSTSSGMAPSTADNWVTTYRRTGNDLTSEYPRIGDVIAGTTSPIRPAVVHFANGYDDSWWSFAVTLAPGQTAIVMNFAVERPSLVAAAAKAASLASLSDDNALACMTATQIQDLANFAVQPPQTMSGSYDTPLDTSLDEDAPGVLSSDALGQGPSPLTATLVSGPAHASSFTLNPDGSFSYVPDSGYVGDDSFTYQAQDGYGLLSSPTTVTIDVVGAAPAIDSASATAFVTQHAGTFTVQATGTPNASLSEVGALPSGVTFTDNGDGTATLAGTPVAGSQGSYPITVTAANGVSSAATQSFTLTVGAFPSGSSESYSGQANTVLTQDAPGVLAGAASGELTPLSAVLVSGPSHSSAFTLNPDGSFSYTPSSGYVGSDSFTFKIKDAEGDLSAATTASLALAGSAPAISSAGATAFTAGQGGSFTLHTSGTPTAGLSESGTLPPGVTFTDNHDGTATLAGTPAAGSQGTYTLTVTAANGVSPSASQTFTLTIANALAIASPAASTFSLGRHGVFTFAATVPDATLTETGALPPGLTFSPRSNGTATLTGTPTSKTGGTYRLTITASNPSGASVTQTFVLTLAPVVTCTSNRDITMHLPVDLSLHRGTTIRSVRATLNGKALAARGSDIVVDLRGKPVGSYAVHVMVKLSDGTTRALSPTFKTCVPPKT